MSGEEGLLVRKIREGTVIDHISAGRGLQVARLLGLENSGYRMAIVSNVESKKLGKKDIVKVEGLFLTSEQINLVSLVAPNATLNIIKEGNVVLKQKVRPPEIVEKILPCPNSSCITRKKGEHVVPRMILVSTVPLLYKCAYCGTYVGEAEIARLL
ncbi:MAG: aspartate carbamoyltransferase regulatory subunit [Acidilobaceae archaeon]|nr:aspartate carbamoyltransferase regulatory subunit [Acidilobaceae archaeon]